MIRSCSFLLLALVASTHALAEKEYALSESETDVRGKAQDVQLTAHAVTVIDGEEVETTYRRDLEDLQGLAPGLIVDSLSGTPQGAAISMRGVGTDDVNNGFLHPGVAVKVDGVYVGTHSSQMQVLFDFEQIDVARGPQGTLDGAPNLGGTINLKRRKPTGEFDVDVRASFGNFNRREYDVAVNFPITKSIAGKVTYSKKEDGGKYMNNVTVDRSENKEDRIATSVALQAKFGGVTANYIYDDEEDNADTPALLNLSTASDQLCIQSGASEDTCAFAADVPQTTSKVLTAQNFSNERDYDGEYHTFTLDFDFAGYEVTSITGVRETSEKSSHDLDASHVDFYSATREQEYEQFSQEVTLRKQFNDNISYSFGFYHLDYNYKLFQEEFYILHALYKAGLACCFAQDEILQTHSAQNGDLQSAFIHGVYVLTQQWTVDAGVRFSKFNKDFSHQPRGWRQPNRVLPSKRSFVGKQTWEETTPTLGVSFKVDNEAMIYLRYATGYLPGGFDENALSIDTAQPTDSQTSDSWEIGMNSEWMDDALRLNMSYFQIDHDDKIEQYPILRSTGQVEALRNNRSNSEITGYEIEFEYIPFSNFYIRGAFAHMNANFRHYAIPDLENLPDAENPGGFIDRIGLEPKRAPRESLYISFQYSKDYLGGTINTYAGYRLYSDYQTNPVLPVAQILNWTTWDLSIDYVWKDWTLRLFSQNVKNKRYLQNVRNISQTAVLAQDVVTTDFAPLITISEYNQPRYSGFEIIFRPDVASLLKKAKRPKSSTPSLSKTKPPKSNPGKLKPTFLSKIPLLNKLPMFNKKDESSPGESLEGEAD